MKTRPKSKDFRIKDDPTLWTKLPKHPDDLMEHLFTSLIEENEAITKLTEKHGCGPYDEPVRKKLTPGQKALVLIYRLDSQILNGGVTQFIWNALFEMNDVETIIKKLGQKELAKLYDKMTDVLNDNEVAWTDIWNQGHDAPGAGAQGFIDLYKLLKLGWFDKAYLSKHRKKLIQALLEYMLARKKDFVRPASA